MQATDRLYFVDPLLVEFEARVLGVQPDDGRQRVVLDRSAFYPEGGGQLSDRGTLAGVAVVDVQIDDAGVVHHVLDGEPPAIGDVVRGEVDRSRRRLHMSLHSAQHVLSRALAVVAGAETVSARLGETACTIDVDVAALADRVVAEAEAVANAVVDDDVPVRAWFPTGEELATLPIRRGPKVEGAVRIVAVGDFDFTPCGGTHCTSSAQIGTVWVTGSERYKSGTRISFAAGRRARQLLTEESALLRGMARELTCGPRDVPAALGKLSRQLEATRDELGRARARHADGLAEQLVARASAAPKRPVVALLEAGSAELLRQVASRVVQVPGVLIVLASVEAGGLPVVVARGEGSRVDCGALLKALAAATGGRGGGRPERAEGRLPLESQSELERVAISLCADLD